MLNGRGNCLLGGAATFFEKEDGLHFRSNDENRRPTGESGVCDGNGFQKGLRYDCESLSSMCSLDLMQPLLSWVSVQCPLDASLPVVTLLRGFTGICE